MSHALVLRGAGGKSSSGGGSELPDSIRSTQTADVLDLISEGEIEGLTHGLQSIYLDGVKLQNADGSFNFEGVQVQLTAGTQGQASITGADGVQNEAAVSVTVTAATPIVRTISNAVVDSVRITIDVQQLTEQDPSNGNLGGSRFEWAVDVQSNSGGYVTVLTDTVEGKTTSRYTRSKQFKLPGVAPWNIRVRRVSADSSSSLVVNAFRWLSYTEIQSLQLRFPNSALARIRVGAQQFSRIPVRAYDVMGIRVRVPSNYDPIAKTYSGVWNGTFIVRWTDCPAWIFYDLVTNNRYGLGRYFAVTDALKWRMYSIGRYCDQMVPDGKGGQEPRFKCGLYITTREQAYKMLADMAAIFRGMSYWAASDMQVVQDAPSDPVATFTAANVVGRFTYSGASHSKRHSQVVVWFNDLADFGRLAPEVVVDRALQRRVGIRSLELSPLGIWSRGQAQRLGKWVLYSEQYEGATVTFRTGLDGCLLTPGKVFQVADPDEAGERLGGRIKTATTSVVTLDSEVTLAAGETYTLGVMLQDPSDASRLVPQKRQVTTAAGARTVLSVSPAFSSAPAAQTIWVLESTGISMTTWRCMGVSEVQGTDQYEVTGIRHEPAKYDLIENGIAFEAANVSRISRVPPAPASLAFTETVYSVGSDQRSRVTLSWPEPAKGLAYLVSWRLANGPWTDMAATTANCVDIDGLVPGALDVVVKSRNALGSLSPGKAEAFMVTGTAAAIVLQASSGTFVFDAAGAAKPAGQVIALRAVASGLAGNATFTCELFTSAGVSLGLATLTGTGSTRMLTVSAFATAGYAVVQTTLNGYSASVTIGRLQDGQAGSPGAAGGTAYALVILVYRQAATQPDAPSGGSYTFNGDVFIPPAGWTRDLITSSTTPSWASQHLFTGTDPNVAIPGPTGTSGNANLGSVVLQLNLEGANGATAFVDSSPLGNTITRSGDVVIQTAQSAWGSGSAYFDGVNDYLAVAYRAELSFSGADFTIEGVHRWEAGGAAQYPTLLDFRGSATDFRVGWCISIDTTNRTLFCYNGVTETVPGATPVNSLPTAGSFFHWAVVRSGSQLLLFLNGSLLSTTTWNPPATHSTGLRIGNSHDLAFDFKGHAQGVRLTKGVALYTTSFSAPTTRFPDSLPSSATVVATEFFSSGMTPYSAVTGTTSPFSVVTGGSQSPVMRIVGATSVGACAIERALAGPNALRVRLRFQIVTAKADDGGIAQFRNGSTALWAFNPIRETASDATRRAVFSVIGGTSYTVSTAALPVGTWLQLEATLSTSAAGTVVISTFSTGAVLYSTPIAALSSAPAVTALGFICDQVSGTAASDVEYAHVELFSPAIPSSALLLSLRFEGANNATTTVDSSQYARAVTLVGNAKLSTTAPMVGTACLLLDGTGDYASVPASTDFNLGLVDFTIKAKFSLSANAALDSTIRDATIISTSPLATGWALRVTGDGTNTGTGLAFESKLSGAQQYVSVAFAFSKNVDYDIEVDRIASTLYFFVQGALVGTGTLTHSLSSGGNPLMIGRNGHAGTTFLWDFPGKLDEVHLVRGYALHFEAFTPLSTAFEIGLYSSAGGWKTPRKVYQDGAGSAVPAQVFIYKRSASPPTLPSVNATYTWPTSSAAATLTGLNNGWAVTPPAGTDPVYISMASIANTNGASTTTILPGQWAGAESLGSGGSAGAAGFNNVTVFLFQRTTTSTPPALPSADVTFTFATNVASGLTNGWVRSMPETGGAYRWLTTGPALSTSATDVITPDDWSPAALSSQDGEDGQTQFVIRLSPLSAVTLAADADGVVGDYGPASVSAAVMYGLTDVSSGWTISRTNGSGVTSTFSSNMLDVLGVSGDQGYVDFNAEAVGQDPITFRYVITKAKAGAQGDPGDGSVGIVQAMPNQTGMDVEGDGQAAEVVFIWRPDGTIGGEHGFGNWYLGGVPTTGEDYYIHASKLTGFGPTDGPSLNNWHSMAGDITWVFSTTNMERICKIVVSISDSPTGSPVLARCIAEFQTYSYVGDVP